VIKWHRKNTSSEWAQRNSGGKHTAEKGLDEEFRLSFRGDGPKQGFQGEFQREFEGALPVKGRFID